MVQKTSQKKISEFFKMVDKEEPPTYKKYFYLSFSNRFTPDYDAVWLDKRPENINFFAEVKCNSVKKGFYFFLCGYFPDYEAEKKFTLPEETKYHNVPYLKSHLQKCVRKMDDLLALPTANHHAKLDFLDFIRRLPIIMLEDTYLNKSFTTIIWIMVAVSSTNFKMKQYIYEWLFGVVYLLCKLPIKDNIKSSFTEDFDISSAECIKSLTEEEISILYSIQIRIGYGGMKGDKVFLNNCINTWYERFKKRSKENKTNNDETNNDKINNEEINDKKEIDRTPIRPISIDIAELDIKEWRVSAIDFHCNYSLLRLMNNKFPDICTDDLKDLIWHNSSKINAREKTEIYLPEKWALIKGYLYSTQKYLLNNGS